MVSCSQSHCQTDDIISSISLPISLGFLAVGASASALNFDLSSSCDRELGDILRDRHIMHACITLCQAIETCVSSGPASRPVWMCRPWRQL